MPKEFVAVALRRHPDKRRVKINTSSKITNLPKGYRRWPEAGRVWRGAAPVCVGC